MAKGNDHHSGIIDNLINYQQPHQNIKLNIIVTTIIPNIKPTL